VRPLSKLLVLCGLAISYGASPAGAIAARSAAAPLRIVFVCEHDHSSLVVSFDQDVAKIVAGRAHYLKWDDLPGVLTDYSRGRDAIIGHLNELIGELARINAP
jgi:hypothetical protein